MNLMNLRRFSFFCGVFFSFGMSFSVLAKTATKVEVVGNKRIESAAIIETMGIKPGKAWDQEAVSKDILSIFELGYFEDVRIYDKGSFLEVVVRERPVVEKIKFVGATEFESKDLKEASELKEFRVLSIAELQSAQSLIAKKYEEKGYYLASSEYKINKISEENNTVEVEFQIFENDQVKIRKIFFLGNNVFSSADLKQVIQSAEGHMFSWATSGGTYREDMFEQDLAMLSYFYGNAGFIQAKIAKPRVTLSQDRRYIDIVIDIDEGEKFYLGDLIFQGNLLFEESELKESFGIEKGEVFSTGALQQEIIALTDKYGDMGYAFANVIPRPQINAKGKESKENTVALVIGVEPGEKVRWGKIKVTGNTKTHDKVLRRELPFAEGELYNATKRKKGFERIQRLGFFGASVNFLTSSPDGVSDVIDLEIRVEEKPTGSLNVNAGYGNAQGFVLGAQVAQNNLMGLGRQLSFNLSLSFGTRTNSSGEQIGGSKTFSLSYTDPHINDSDYIFGTNLIIDEYDVGNRPKSYTKRLSGGSIKLGKEVKENLFIYSSYRLHHNLFTDVASPDIFTNFEKDKESYVSAVSMSLEYDTRNNRLDPSGGWYLSSNAEIAGLGGRRFLGWNSSARWYKNLFGSMVYRSRLEYGVVWSYGGDTVPDSQRFTLGGVFSIRGYDQNTVGPTRTAQSERAGEEDSVLSFVYGGTQKVVLNQELEFTLIPEANIRGVLFFDAGNSWNGNIGDNSPTVLSNYGWGIRWYSPLGPLRFEWGYPLALTDLKRDYSPVFNFIIAPSF